VRRVLILEPNSAFRSDVATALQAAGYSVVGAAQIAQAELQLRSVPIDAVLVDIESRASLAVIDQLIAQCAPLGVVAMSADPSVELVVEAMRCGAVEFLRKPFSVSALERAIGNAAGLQETTFRAEGQSELLTQDPTFQRLLGEAQLAAASGATLLLVGENGSGKDSLARFIHRRSARRGGPYVVINCAALPEALAESELFGHERGAFTGATERRSGQIAAAHTGTLVLDEISDTPAALQAKFLRVLQEREVLPVGAATPRLVDVRVIATTQRELADEVEAGRFREDLYYRLNVIVLRTPPLRERPLDIELLARHFLKRFAERSRVEAPRLSTRALARLEQHAFRGNVRELENLMRRAIVLFPGREIHAEHLLGQARSLPAGSEVSGGTLNLREIEKQTILRSLQEAGGNRTHASQVLGISVRTLRNKIRLYGLA